MRRVPWPPVPQGHPLGHRRLPTGARPFDSAVAVKTGYTPVANAVAGETLTLELICRKVRAGESKADMVKDFVNAAKVVFNELCARHGIDPKEHEGG